MLTAETMGTLSTSDATPTDMQTSDSGHQGLLTVSSNNSRPTSKTSLMTQEQAAAAERARQLPRHDEHAGALEPVGSDEEEEEDELLPPMYDPSWENGRLRVRQSTDGQGRARANARAAAILEPIAGPSRRMSM